MKRIPHFSLITLLIVVVAVTLQTCSSKDAEPTGPTPNQNPATITISPASGAPGALLNISGYAVNPADTATEIYIGGELSVFRQDSSGIQSMIPLFLDSVSHWPAPPSGMVDVEIRKNGEVVALASAAVTVDSLQHADGATETLNQDFIKLANSLNTIWSALPSIPGEDSAMAGYRQAVMTMLDSTLSGADSSLASVLAGTSSWTNGQLPDVSLFDALLASSGALDFYNDAAGSLGRLTDSLTLARQQGLLCKGGGPDMNLACQMQIYVVLDDYATYFVKPTSQTYANTVGLVAGIVAISGYRFPPEVIISSLMVVFDFVYGTLAPSLFPAEISEFSLTVATDTIAIDEMTNTAVLVAAVNKPATIRATDILEQLLIASGLAKAPGGIAQSFRAVLTNAMKWALGMYRKGAIAYNNNTGGSVFIDPEADLPPMSWGPVMVTHSDLVELYSFTEDLVTADTASFEWTGVARGDGRIQARGRAAGERSRVLYDNALCLGCIYSGGAFGNNAPGTDTKTVVVGRQATLDVLITGLPAGTDASVIVSGPDGYSSGTLVSSKMLKYLDPGTYHLTAIEVRDDTGEPYKAKPVDTSVTLAGGDNLSVTIAYKKKFGSLLVTVSGLPAGIDADIDVAGMGVAVHAIGDTLLDSLPEGTYTIQATSIFDPHTSQTLNPDPQSQSVEVSGGQTATAGVDYSGKATMTLFVGNATDIFPSRGTNAPVYMFSSAAYTSDTIQHIVRLPDTLFDVKFGCVDGELQGGGILASVHTNASATFSSSSASLSYSAQGKSRVTISFSATASSSATPAGNATDASGTAYSVIDAYGWVILKIENTSSVSVDVMMDYSIGGSSTFKPLCNGDSYFGIRTVSYCEELGVLNVGEMPILVRAGCAGDGPHTGTNRLLTVGAGGVQYMELFNHVVIGANSWYLSDHPSRLSTLEGHIDIYLTP